MSVPRSSQLEWVHRNRQPRTRTARVGAVLPELFKADFSQDVRHRGQVQRAIAELVDDEFREVCMLGPTDRSSVTILVEHPTMLPALRLTWCFLLVEHLDRRCQFRVTPKVKFVLGRSPDRFVIHEQFSD